MTETYKFGMKKREGHNSSTFYNLKVYQEVDNKTKKITNNEFPSELKNKIILHTSEKMYEIPDNSVHLVITSPPYNVAKEYDEDLSLDEYLSLLYNVFKECFRVLCDGGRACINIANIGRKPYIPLTRYIYDIMEKIGFLSRGEIIWNKSASAGTSTAWGSWCSASNPVLRDVHEYILIFSKNKFKRELSKKEKEYKINTLSKEEFLEYTKSIWTFNAVSAKKIGHPAPFPIELPKRLIKLYSFKDDIILDPFLGSGTTAIAAIQTGRSYIGYEIKKEYFDLAQKRIEQSKNLFGELL
jgi:site-specific DNA-methyltransferase (adenine-specific)